MWWDTDRSYTAIVDGSLISVRANPVKVWEEEKLLTSKQLLRVREHFAATSALIAIVIGTLVLIGWVVDSTLLKSVVSGLVTMKANTAICFVLFGAALLSAQGERGPRWHMVGVVCSATVFAIVTITLFQVLSGIDLGIDQLLFAEPGVINPGRMGTITAVVFLLLSVALLMYSAGRATVLAQVCTISAMVLAGLCTVSYLYALDSPLDIVQPFAAVALHTALALSLLSGGVLITLFTPRQLDLFTSENTSSMLARRLLPLAVILPVLIGWFGLVGQEIGWYGVEFNMAFITVIRVAFLVALVLWTALKVSRYETDREAASHKLRESEERLRQLNTDLERQVNERTFALQQSEQRFRAIFNAQFQFIGLMTTDGILLEANLAALSSAGLQPGDVIGKPFWDTLWWVHDEGQRERLKDAVRRAAAGEHMRFEASHRGADGSLIWVDFSLTPFRNSSGEVIMLIPEGHDITERKKADQELRLQEDLFRSAFEFAPIGIALLAADGRWLRVNRSLCELVGYSEEEMLQTDFQSITHPEDVTIGMEYVRLSRTGEINSFQVEKRYLHKLGFPVSVLLAASSVKDASGKPVYFIAQIQDITQRKLAEKEMAARDAMLRHFIKYSPAAIAMLDRDMRYMQVSGKWNLDYALTGQDVIGVSHYDVFPDMPERWKQVHQRVLAGAVERCDEDLFEREDGSRLWLEWECRPWHRSDGGVGGVIMFTQVITARKLAEEQVKSSLREKEVLLKEIHHRVKNNLQIVSALLDLQSEHTSNPEALEMFRESRSRVKSMALIHERLYRSQDMAHVNFTDYVRQLVDDLYQTYKISDDEIRLDLDVNIMPLSIDLAIPCGLLLNELITNCFKHAFRGRTRGNIRVALHADNEECVVLTVADDGVGFPAGIDLQRTASFGMQLVNTLAEQLNGDITVTGNEGAAFMIRFRNSKR